MSRFLSNEAARLDPYTPGEQPQDMQYIKLNTNESPFPPSPKVIEAVSQAEVSRLNLYSDPTCAVLVNALAKRYGLRPENVLTGNGSDEILAFAFRAFCGEGKGVAYADVTYGFYKAQVALFGLNATVIPLREDFTLNVDDYMDFPGTIFIALREDFTLNVDDYMDFPGTIFIANPNAPTGIALPPSDIRRLLEANPDRVVVIDEAYVDFGADSCVPLIADHDNLLVVQTMSKSRSLAGGRVGYALGSAELIAGLNRVKYSFNPYNVNRLSIIAGAAAVEDEPYSQSCCASIRENRAWTAEALTKLGFTVLPSSTNFLFAKSDRLSGEELYRKLKAEGILVRWWANSGRIEDYVRITVGSMAQMEPAVDTIEKLLKEAE